MKTQTSLRLAFEGRDYIEINIYASFVGAKEEYRQSLCYSFGTGQLTGCDATYIAHSPNDSFDDEADQVPEEILGALESEIRNAIQVILDRLAKRNLQPIVPLAVTQTSV